MSMKKDDLTSEVCQVVITKLAYLAVSGQEEVLKAIGVSDAQISRLERLSYRELDGWIRQRKGALDITPLMQALFSDAEPPEEHKTFLLHGANNKMMMHFFGVRAEECCAFRDKLSIDKSYRGRSISHKQHSAVCKALMEQGDYRQISADALLQIARTYQVSLGALWKELEKWDKEHEQ
ncbi:STY4526/YPO1902 family pathogenicity island replication protein [Vibrio splendidus]|uniref:DUF2857 domain-containing protein n=2 Tax=Vibrio TaxID=662 RepID=A0A1E5FCP9_VIBSP|nr:STY4526/YPO1902 family pathogenicity island replication protein [Vibrio splendidus]OEF86845.1 hypothetical protein A142_23815 [Vibrio splendidus 12E03]